MYESEREKSIACADGENKISCIKFYLYMNLSTLIYFNILILNNCIKIGYCFKKVLKYITFIEINHSYCTFNEFLNIYL